MTLIATMGATLPRYEHRYVIDGDTHTTHFSFQSIQKHMDIPSENIYIIGTKKTFETLREHLIGYQHIEIPDDKNEAKFIFATIQELADERTYLDLTQGFRHIPMMALLSSLYAKNRKDVKIKEIFYAKTTNPNENPSQMACHFDFVSLMEYVDISNLSTIIETFLHSAVVPTIHIKDKKLDSFIKELQEVSNSIFANDITTASKNAKELLDIITSLKKDGFDEYDIPFQRLSDDVDTLHNLGSKKESEQLLGFSHYCFDKNLLMQSLTLLFESMLAFAEEEARDRNLKLKGKNRNRELVECLSMSKPFDRRNCIKKSLRHAQYKSKDSIIFYDDYKKLLDELDKFRNAMAHAFTGEDLKKNPRGTIQSFIDRYYNIKKAYDE